VGAVTWFGHLGRLVFAAMTLAFIIVAALVLLYSLGAAPQHSGIVTGTPGDLSEEEAGLAYVRSRTPFARLGEANDVASAVAFLASEASSFMTGQVVCVDGGWTSV